MSDQAPLNIRHIGKYADGPESPFLDKVLPQSHRSESVTIHQPNTDVAAKYFSVSAPMIKSFLLSSPAGGLPQPGGLSSVFGGRLENLEELRVAECGSVGWRGLSCTRLRLLDIGGEHSLDMGVMLDIVAANPNLEVIRMRNLFFAQYIQPKPSPAPIHLENLRELTLKDIPHITEDGYSGLDVPMVHILQCIQLRPNIAFNMKEELQTDSFVKPEKFISLIPTPVAILAYISQMAGFQSAEVNAEFAGKSILLEIRAHPRSKPIFSVEVDGLPQPLAKKWMVGGLEEATRTPMDLRLHFANVPEEPTLSLDDVFHFQLWESVKNLSFPKLQNLHLLGLSGIKAKDMLEMVRARFAPHRSTEAAVYREVPAPMTIYCGNGVGGWGNKNMDDILATPGVKGIKGSEEAASSSSSSSPESEWPPPYDFYNNYHSGHSDWVDSEISLLNSDPELSLHDSDAEDDVDDI
ncbi:hypothetical protein M407DRAFT_26562 [Tulasnella calospora MUT 4182]|uniref:F-box domain-containing protein n=1 Tax=Tulasnella calospora MUT 4182 TaxID=1051891 RepID=A0A0C3LRK2_9AGAM|nr:hypothetical protein M407DRAFT_26562 [Tulasnella calospora MUT 4182]